MKTLTGASVDGGAVTISYNESVFGKVVVGTKNLKAGAVTASIRSFIEGVLGQKVRGFQVYTQASDPSGDGLLIDIFRNGDQDIRVDELDEGLLAERNKFVDAAQAALKSGAAEV